MNVSSICLVLGVLLLAVLPGSADPEADPDVHIEKAIAAFRKAQLSEAVAHAGRAIEANPKRSRGWQLRAQLYGRMGEHAKAVADWDEVLKREPKLADAWQRRGEAQFKRAKINEAIADWDQYLKLAPAEKPHHWQRGIALYYAGRYADGKQQFELHQTVNTQDVENAVWHFLCTTRAEGLAAARKQLIPITGDLRVPMMEVQRLFAGKATPQDVMTAAQAAPAKTPAGEPLFYAHLYLGIYFDATGDAKKAREHILLAAERSKENGYMGDVARVHAELMQKKKPE